MNRDLSLAKEKRFSFIHTLTIYSHQKNCELERYLSLGEIERVDLEKLISIIANSQINSESSSSSSLCNQNYQASNSLLNINSLENIPNTISESWYSFDSKKETTSVIYVPELESTKYPKKPYFNRYLDKILLIFASGYLCFVLWLLFANKNTLFPLAFLSSQTKISQADAEFIDYMKQSLEVIEPVAIEQSSAKTIAANRTSEVVYVPVYTPTEINSSKQNNFTQPNTLLPPPPPPNNLAALTPPNSNIKIKPPLPPSESVKVKTTPNESSIKNAVTSVTKSIAESKTPREIVTTISPNIEHTLVGVMELKEGSAALFRIGDVTQKIGLGEEIESTGWILESVTDRQAIISARGKTLSLRVGETFKGDL